MAIYTRRKNGELEPLKIPAIKGEKGDKGDSGVYVGDVSSAPEYATIIVDDSDEGLFFEGQYASIDDNTVTKDKTWSSSRIEDFVLNNVGAIWKELNGGQSAIDNSMEGFLREVEILGNTIQNPEDLDDVQHLGIWNEEKQGYEIEIKVSNSLNVEDKDYQEYKTTILLPCQLMKIGDVSDKMYWSSIKGRYVIEKNIKDANIPNLGNIKSSLDASAGGCKYSNTFYNVSEWNSVFNNIGLPGATYWEAHQAHLGKPMMMIPGTKIQSHYNNVWMNGSIKNGKILSISNQASNLVQVLFRDTTCSDVEQMNEWVKTFEGKKVNYTSLVPELIDTNITEQLKLPTFMTTTHISVFGNISGSIKAKVPVDGNKTVNTLMQENQKLKTINAKQEDEINTSLIFTEKVFSMIEPLLDISTLSNEDTISEIAKAYNLMVTKGLKSIEEVPNKYRIKLTKEGE